MTEIFSLAANIVDSDKWASVVNIVDSDKWASVVKWYVFI